MKGEKVFFRKRFFGGFNRKDVIKYISKIADERNDAIAEKKVAESNVQALTEELAKLRRERGELGESFATAGQTETTEQTATAETLDNVPNDEKKPAKIKTPADTVTKLDDEGTIPDDAVGKTDNTVPIKTHPSARIKVKMGRK